uniref:G-protein coupled receptors family 1 profile domain-containing protein n=1 Tax=Erpetoichthys calabaricus TaxID=27687 RepID=A0A8C4X422_ERPCA
LNLGKHSSFWENQTDCASTTSRNSSVSLKTARQPTYAFFNFIFMVIVMLTVCGNLAVIISVSHFKQLHIPSNFLVLSLAMADFLIGIIVMSLIMVQSIRICWCFSDVFCLIFSFTDVFLMSVSIHNLMLIAVDCYIAVCAPFLFSNKMTIQVTSVLISLNWIISLIYTLLIIYYKENVGQNYLDPCPGDCVLVSNSTCAIVDLIYSFLLPVSVMITLYAKIFLIAKRHARAISTQQKNSVEKNKNISKKSERKAAKTLGIVVTVFFLCWLPFYVCSLLNQFMNFAVSSVVSWACLWIGYINSGLNPIIYALFYPWFRKSFKLLITCKICNAGSSLISLMNVH